MSLCSLRVLKGESCKTAGLQLEREKELKQMLLCWNSLFSDGERFCFLPMIFPTFRSCLSVHLCDFDHLISWVHEAEELSSITYLVLNRDINITYSGTESLH